jgi:hypothetical protein
MNREDIIHMARNEYGIYAFTAESLAEFATIIAAAECEECAKVCENKNILLEWPTYAAAIRARGNT